MATIQFQSPENVGNTASRAQRQGGVPGADLSHFPGLPKYKLLPTLILVPNLSWPEYRAKGKILIILEFC